jgi:hypothetical protein
MKKPIYFVEVKFQWSNRKKTLRATKSKDAVIEVITTCTTASEILTDKYMINKLLRKIKKRANDISLRITNVRIISEHGETNDRF